MKQKRTKRVYQKLFDEVSGILFRHNPIGIASSDYTDEYDPEAAVIISRLSTVASPSELRTVIHAVFVEWFFPETVGSEESYGKVAEEIWKAWLRHKQNTAGS